MDRALGFRFVMDWASTLIRPVYELAAADRGALVIAHPLAFGARVAEERLGVRVATLLLSPAILRLGDTWVKRSMRWAADRLIADRVLGPSLNAFRAAKGLPPVTRVLSRGWDDEHLHVAMFPWWFADELDGPRNFWHAGFPLYDAAPAEELPASVGEAPIVFTAGTGNRAARAFFEAAIDAAERLRRRAILLTAHREQLPQSLPPGVEHFSYLPLSRVLPCASALVHHGGIGSAAAALAAGVPQLVVPFAHDQPDNAARLARLGVAAVLSPPRATGARMAARLAHLLHSQTVQGRCRALAATVESGLDGACDALEAYAYALAHEARLAGGARVEGAA